MINKLKKEYQLRYNLVRYQKLNRRFTNTLIEKNNYDFLVLQLIDVNKSLQGT